MSADAAFLEAQVLQWTWKTPAMERMAVGICRLALARGLAGEFSANDLERSHQGGGGIAGAVFHRLADDEVIAPVGSFVAGEFVQRYVRNGGGNRIGVWRLRNAARAQRLLAVHDRPQRALEQAELLPA